jgi:phosphatidylglycerophosphatase A
VNAALPPDRPLAGSLRPTWRFLVAHPAHLVALGFGCGLSPVAPGTVGTLWAWLVFGFVHPLLGDPAWAVLLAALALVAWWSGTVAARGLGTTDPGSVVIEEIVAFWIVLWLLLPAGWLAQAVAFALFRFFDAVKPGPVAWADKLFKARRGEPIGWPQGFGILFDDLVAALCTLLVIALWRSFA